jgi:transcriptional/translational regulatory protein YebC/TACO1
MKMENKKQSGLLQILKEMIEIQGKQNEDITNLVEVLKNKDNVQNLFQR